MDQQQRIEELIDELYAVQKQAGDRMVELTNENKWILDKQERNVTSVTPRAIWHHPSHFECVLYKTLRHQIFSFA